MKIHFINVGHGDTTLIDFDGIYMLIDCNINGTDDYAYKYIDDVVIENGGIKKIDYVVITHPDKDHIKGLDIIKENFEIGEIWESGFRRAEDAEESPEYDEFIKIIEEKGSKELVASDLALDFSVDNVEVYCLNSKSDEEDDAHFNSLVMKFIINQKSIIFAGDSNCEAWKNKIMEQFKSHLDVDMLHASHHGSRTFFFEKNQDKDQDSPYIEALEATSPDYVIISGCDRDDKVKEDWPPHDDAIELYEEYTGSSGGLYITGEDGNLVFDLSGSEILLNEKASNNYRFITGKYQKYKRLKAPFTPGTGKPKGKITRDSFGE